MAELKTQPTAASVDDFIASLDDERRRAECQEVAAMMKDVTGEEPVMWGTSIVGFGRYRYTYDSGHTGEWPVIGFSPRKTTLTLYIMPGFERFPKIMEQLGKYGTGKSCLYLKKLSDVNRAALRELVERSVKHMEPQRVRASGAPSSRSRLKSKPR